jgi:hypothetical protein
MIEELCQRYPKTFTHKPHDVRPVARGIREAIIADAPDLPASIVSQAAAIYAAWLPYLRACIAGAPGVVTEKEAMYAVQRLAARERKRGEGRGEREAAVRKAQEASFLGHPKSFCNKIGHKRASRALSEDWETRVKFNGELPAGPARGQQTCFPYQKSDAAKKGFLTQTYYVSGGRQSRDQANLARRFLGISRPGHQDLHRSCPDTALRRGRDSMKHA